MGKKYLDEKAKRSDGSELDKDEQLTICDNTQ